MDLVRTAKSGRQEDILESGRAGRFRTQCAGLKGFRRARRWSPTSTCDGRQLPHTWSCWATGDRSNTTCRIRSIRRSPARDADRRHRWRGPATRPKQRQAQWRAADGRGESATAAGGFTMRSTADRSQFYRAGSTDWMVKLDAGPDGGIAFDRNSSSLGQRASCRTRSAAGRRCSSDSTDIRELPRRRERACRGGKVSTRSDAHAGVGRG